MWPDNETSNDLIGFRVHADLIRAVVTNPKMLPTIIGVFGDWGGGKTSIMKMLENDLTPEEWPADSPERSSYENVAVLFFNTWLFEGYDDSKSAILASVLLQLGEHKRFGSKVRDNVVSLLKSVNWMRLGRLGLTHVAVPAAAAFLTGGAAAVPAAFAALAGVSNLTAQGKVQEKDEPEKSEKIDWGELIKKSETSADAPDVRSFRSRFEKMLKDADINSMVVLIDDLDRCTPDRIIENLEAIKLFMNVEHTAFVVGADPRIVEHAIRSRYAERALDNPQDREESDRLVKDYLEKLVQVPYHLPRLSGAEIETYMVLLFCQRHLAEEEFALCRKACEEERTRNRYSTFGYAGVREALQGQELKEEFSGALAFCAGTAPLIADGLKGNPRQVKRFLNSLLLRKELARVAKLENIRDDVLVKLMILEYTNDKLFTDLFEWQCQHDGYPKQLAELEAAILEPGEENEKKSGARNIDAGWSSPRLRKWLAMEPQLSVVDLRDYFWVARDKLASTFTGLTMVPPLVRKVLDDLLSGNLVRRNTALKSASSLREDERQVLLNLMEQNISRQPQVKAGYDALRYLTDAGTPGAAETFRDIFLHRAPDKMPPAVGMDLVTLLNAKPQLASVLQPAIARLSQSKTKIGTAVNSAIKKN
ncbi:MAG: P-loop NTPase fold protein [Candidatus Binatus sp.]|jgi:hypothetical protein